MAKKRLNPGYPGQWTKPYRPEAAPACSSFVASTLPSYDSMVLVMMTVVVSPRWMVWAVVVTVRVTLQLDRRRAIRQMTRRIRRAAASNCFLERLTIIGLIRKIGLIRGMRPMGLMGRMG